MDNIDALLATVRDCTICAADLPLRPRPIVRGTPDAKLLMIGHAPGTGMHESGVPWNDPSGERLRDWLQMTPDDFYDETNLPSCLWVSAIRVPMRKAAIIHRAPNAHLNGTHPFLQVCRMSN
mgnify:CR=1 FL=1